jgi:hypothetical protein
MKYHWRNDAVCLIWLKECLQRFYFPLTWQKINAFLSINISKSKASKDRIATKQLKAIFGLLK